MIEINLKGQNVPAKKFNIIAIDIFERFLSIPMQMFRRKCYCLMLRHKISCQFENCTSKVVLKRIYSF